MSELRELTENDVALSRVPPRYWSCSLTKIPDDFVARVGPAGGERVTFPLSAFIRGYGRSIAEHLENGTGLYLWGENGTGKTAIACMIALEARRRHLRSFFIRSEEVMRAYLDRETFEVDQFEDPISIWKAALTTHVLVVDELGKGMSSKNLFSADIMGLLLRIRADEGLITIITSNESMADLDKIYGHSVTSLLTGSVAEVEVSGVDRRAASTGSLYKGLFGLVDTALKDGK